MEATDTELATRVLIVGDAIVIERPRAESKRTEHTIHSS